MTATEYEAAMKRVTELFLARLPVAHTQELEALLDAIEKYEERHYPINEPKSSKG